MRRVSRPDNSKMLLLHCFNGPVKKTNKVPSVIKTMRSRVWGAALCLSLIYGGMFWPCTLPLSPTITVRWLCSQIQGPVVCNKSTAHIAIPQSHAQCTAHTRAAPLPLLRIRQCFYYVKLIRAAYQMIPSCGTEPCVQKGSRLNMIRINWASITRQ